jgi:hypothetical protein
MQVKYFFHQKNIKFLLGTATNKALETVQACKASAGAIRKLKIAVHKFIMDFEMNNAKSTNSHL